MKRFLFCLIAFMLTFTVASASDVGVQLQTDVGSTYTGPTMQQNDFIPQMAILTPEAVQIVEFSYCYTSKEKVSTQSTTTPTECLWIDPGRYVQVSVTTQLNIIRDYNTYRYRPYKNDYHDLTTQTSKPINPTARHVKFFS